MNWRMIVNLPVAATAPGMKGKYGVGQIRAPSSSRSHDDHEGASRLRLLAKRVKGRGEGGKGAMKKGG